MISSLPGGLSQLRAPSRQLRTLARGARPDMRRVSAWLPSAGRVCMPLGVNESGINRLRNAHLHLDLQSLNRRPAEYGPGTNAAVDPPAGDGPGGNPSRPVRANPQFASCGTPWGAESHTSDDDVSFS